MDQKFSSIEIHKNLNLTSQHVCILDFFHTFFHWEKYRGVDVKEKLGGDEINDTFVDLFRVEFSPSKNKTPLMMPLKSILTVDNSLNRESKLKLKFMAGWLLGKLMTCSYTHTYAHQSKSSATSNKSSEIRKFYCPINSIPVAMTKQQRLNEEENCRKITCCVYVCSSCGNKTQTPNPPRKELLEWMRA